MTPEEFKQRAQNIYDKNHGEAGESGHIEVDDLMDECLRSIGYEEGLDILWSVTDFWYS